jgi:hypothetical protein
MEELAEWQTHVSKNQSSTQEKGRERESVTAVLYRVMSM